jgi:hypothetical protein
MASVSNTDILEDVMELMNPEDEVVWLRGGLFNDLGASGLSLGTDPHLSLPPNSTGLINQPYTASPICPKLTPSFPVKIGLAGSL